MILRLVEDLSVQKINFIDKNTKKGDRVVDPLASQLQGFARGETN